MYSKLADLINNYQNITASTIFIAGDFNSKVGKTTGNESYLGQYSRGRRNNSGQCLIDFCEIHQLFIANSAFQHKASHITTWEQHREDKKTGKMIHIYNQIDFVLVKSRQKNTLIDARAYSGTNVNSDHRLVLTRLHIEPYKLFINTNRSHQKRYNLPLLTNNHQIRTQYQQSITNKLKDLKLDNTHPQ